MKNHNAIAHAPCVWMSARFRNTIFTHSTRINGVFTLSETENDLSSETDKMLKSSQSHWLLLAILSVSLQKSFSVSLSVKTS